MLGLRTTDARRLHAPESGKIYIIRKIPLQKDNCRPILEIQLLFEEQPVGYLLKSR